MRVGKLITYNIDGGAMTEQSSLDLLMEILNTSFDIGKHAEFGESVPEICITVPAASYHRLQEAAKYSQYRSCYSGEHAVSGLPFFKYDYSKLSVTGPCFVLIVQQGVGTAATEVIQ